MRFWPLALVLVIVILLLKPWDQETSPPSPTYIKPTSRYTKPASPKDSFTKHSPALEQTGPLIRRSQKTVEATASQKNSYTKKRASKALVKIVGRFAIAGKDQILGAIDPEQETNTETDYEVEMNEIRLWEEAVVPFTFEQGFPQYLVERVNEALSYFSDVSHVEFVQYDANTDENAVVFTYNADLPCSSFLGRTGGLQPLFLNEQCSTQVILHEIMHVLGFVHEQQLPSRDNFVDVIWDNIKPDSLHNFSLLPESVLSSYQGTTETFDYTSVMMYQETAFSVNDLPTIKSTTAKPILPTASGLSEVDIERINTIY